MGISRGLVGERRHKGGPPSRGLHFSGQARFHIYFLIYLFESRCCSGTGIAHAIRGLWRKDKTRLVRSIRVVLGGG